jgi:hypothetical protein
MACPSCGTHWCWECGKNCENSENTYQHMWEVHKRIFEEDVVYEDDDDEEEDYI